MVALPFDLGVILIQNTSISKLYYFFALNFENLVNKSDEGKTNFFYYHPFFEWKLSEFTDKTNSQF